MPPPPPPPPTLPLPFGQKPNGTKASSTSPAPDRNALLSQIRKGSNLKRVQTNDRSSPLVNSSASKSAPVGTTASPVGRANGPLPLIPPGGLFAHGMPKLRPTGSRPGDASGTHADNSLSAALNRSDAGGSRSHPPSPASKVRQSPGLHRSLTESAGNRNFPSDLNLKGPAPAPPPSNMKPSFQESSAPANRHPTVRRSVSQTSLGPKARPYRLPPNVRPPPPPKSTSVLQSGVVGPPALPSKPPNVTRRQSFGVSDVHLAANLESMRLAGRGLTAPPPPPRNNSVPNSLDNMPNTSPTTVHVSRMSIAPPPPPPFRPGSGLSRAPSMRPPDPPARPPGPHPAPPSQMKAVPTSHSVAPPPPPTRVSSVMSSQPMEPISDFECRFFYKFHSLQSLPPPPKYCNLHKAYPSKLIREKSARRQPPPPPPANNLLAARQHIGHQPVLHIQLQSRVFVNNAAHC